MRVDRLTAWHVRVPLRKKIRHASHTRDENQTVIVRCRLNSGAEGWGEGLPREYVTGETIETALEQLRTTDFRKLSTHCESPGDMLGLLEELRLHEEARDRRRRFGNAARCALELAVLDAVCRTLHVPLSTVTSWVPEAESLRRSAAAVRYSGVIPSGSPHKQRIRALGMRLFGFRQIKVKVGTSGIDDVSLLSRVRRWSGRGMDLRVDANEAWSESSAAAHISKLQPFDVSSFEQPVPADEANALRSIRKQTGAVIMLDEALCSMHDARVAIEDQLCDLFNIRLSKCGGFLRSVRLAALACEAGLGYQLGCQVGESAILSAAGRHFATSVADPVYLEGSYDRYLVRESLGREDITFGRGGLAPALKGPGLGITVDAESIQRLAVEQLELRTA